MGGSGKSVFPEPWDNGDNRIAETKEQVQDGKDSSGLKLGQDGYMSEDAFDAESMIVRGRRARQG